MKKIVPHILFFLISFSTYSQGVFFNMGKNFSTFSYKNRSAFTDKLDVNGVGDAYEIGYTDVLKYKNFKDLKFTGSVTMNDYNAIAESALNRLEWKTTYLGVQSTVDYQFYAEKDGLSPNTASSSAYQIKQDYPNSTDGFYWIKNANINGGAPFKIYADMTTASGGWTLILKNSTSAGWNYANAILLNAQIPYTSNAEVISTGTSNYSIVGWADYIKRSPSGFQYMIDANARRSYGGIWTANGTYSFTKGDNTQTDITLDTKYGTWNYVTNNNGIQKVMPWYSNSAGGGYALLTLATSTGNWWGTLVSAAGGGYTPAPWISDANGGAAIQNPGIIWYWVR